MKRTNPDQARLSFAENGPWKQFPEPVRKRCRDQLQQLLSQVMQANVTVRRKSDD
jgi:hypothetical protein